MDAHYSGDDFFTDQEVKAFVMEVELLRCAALTAPAGTAPPALPCPPTAAARD